MPKIPLSKETDTRLNGIVADALRDFADLQGSTYARWGYKKASKAIRNLEDPIGLCVQPDGRLRKIPNVGPSSTRIILEILNEGHSATVERALAASAERATIEARQLLRQNFFTRAEALELLRSAEGEALRAAYKGDLQMHSTWSDGSQTLEDIVRSRSAAGYTFSAITDHSYGLPIAGGLSMAQLATQHHEIDTLNRNFPGFSLLKGIEANIRSDGTVDMEPEELRQLEIVVAAPHSVLRRSHDQTERVLTAIRTPGVHILGHGRGRMYGSRPGLSVRWPEVFREARSLNVAIEIDGDPARQDLDYSLAREALDAGCVLAVDTDAHSVHDMAFVDLALAHAVKAGATPDRIINCWDLEHLRDWADLAWER